MKFTIIIPVYNGENYIIRALESTINQTFKDYDVVVVNDGSIDNTQTLVESFINDNLDINNVKLINTENFGRSVARNIGILNSKGDYLCFLDADDFLLPNHLISFDKAIELYPLCHCFFANSDIQRTDTNWNVYDEYLQRFMARGNFWKAEGNYIVFDHHFTDHLIQGSLIPMCSTAINKAAILNSGMFNSNFNSAEDFDFWIRLSLREQFIAVNDKLSVVVHHTENTSHPSNKAKNLLEQLKVTSYIIHQQNKLSSEQYHLLKTKQIRLFRDALYFISKKSTIETLKVVSDNIQICRFAVIDIIKAVMRSILFSLKG